MIAARSMNAGCEVAVRREDGIVYPAASLPGYYAEYEMLGVLVRAVIGGERLVVERDVQATDRTGRVFVPALA